MVHTMKDHPRRAKRVRRTHEQGFKEGLIARSLVPGASVAAIAMEGGVNANLLFKWRREHVRAKVFGAAPSTSLVPVCVIGQPDRLPAPQPHLPAIGDGASRGTRTCVIELEIAGARLRLRGAVDEAMLGSVLRALRQSQ